MSTRMRRWVVATLALALLHVPPVSAEAAELTEGETAKIAEEAFVYGFPMVMNYAVFYEYFVDRSSPEYKAPPNQLYNTARVYTPADKAVVTPNSDTPYSFVAMDLRAEPFVFCNPDPCRPGEVRDYFSVLALGARRR